MEGGCKSKTIIKGQQVVQVCGASARVTQDEDWFRVQWLAGSLLAVPQPAVGQAA